MKHPAHFVDQNDWSVAELNALVAMALDIEQSPAAYQDLLRHRVMATVFLEPSTRTQLSFQTAMLRLGGQYITMNDPQTSSLAKGESLMDTLRVVGSYADVMVLRHPCEGAARLATTCVPAGCAVINAGDGGHLHPTQTLTDLVTLMRVKGRLSGLRIGLCGDLKYGRTVHSLIQTMSRYADNEFVLIAPKGLALPAALRQRLTEQQVKVTETPSLSEAIDRLDVLYMTRVQRERFETAEITSLSDPVSGARADAQSDWMLDAKTLQRASKELCVLHPLPRVTEIAPEVDTDPRAMYFLQASMGVPARMALLVQLLEQGEAAIPGKIANAMEPLRPCQNPHCITHQQPDLTNAYRLETESGDCYVCFFCDQRQFCNETSGDSVRIATSDRVNVSPAESI